MVKDRYGNKLEGFYIVGFFEKSMRASFHFQKQQPFETDENGISHGKCFPSYPTNRFATDWEFIEGESIRDLDCNTELGKEMNGVWERWCKKNKRKYTPIFNESSLKSRDTKQ